MAMPRPKPPQSPYPVHHFEKAQDVQHPSDLNDTIEKILMAAESRQAARVSSAAVFDNTPGMSKSASMSSSMNGTLDCHGGPLTAPEMSHLRVLCASLSEDSPVVPSAFANGRMAAANTGVGHEISRQCSDLPSDMPQKIQQNGWASVEYENLSLLTPLLEEHVRSAACVDMIGEARSLHDKQKSASHHISPASIQHFPPADYYAATPSATFDMWLTRNARLFYTGLEDSASPGYGFYRFSILQRGLEAATILLSIMTYPGIDQRVVNEDGIEASVSLMRQHLNRNVIPALSNTGHCLVASTATEEETTSILPEPEYFDENEERSKKKQKKLKGDDRNTTQQDLIQCLKKVYKPVLSTVGLLSLLMEEIDVLIKTVQVDDQPLLSICSSALSSLALDPSSSTQSNSASISHIIQTTSIGLISTIFIRYPRHRTIIIEDLFPLMLKLPTSKKSLRTFPVRVVGRNQDAPPVQTPPTASVPQPSCYVQVISVLVLFMIQGCVTMPIAVESEESRQSVDSDRFLPRLSSGLQDSHSICNLFVMHMIQRCSRKGEEGGASEFRPVLSNLVEDLLTLQLMPEFPAATILLLSFCRRLSHDLLSNSSVGGKKNASSTVSAETTYLATAMDTLGSICANIAMQVAAQRENPFKLPTSPGIDDDERTGNFPVREVKEVNRCFCGRETLINTFMLDCDRCHAWFHGSCVGVNKDKLPDLWICDQCILQTIVIEQTKAFSERCSRNRSNEENDSVIDAVDETHTMRQIFLNFLTSQLEAMPSTSLKIARQYHLAIWIESLEKIRHTKGQSLGLLDADLMCAHFFEQWNMPELPAEPEAKLDMNRLAENKTTNSNTKRRQLEHRHLSNEGNAKLVAALAIYSDLTAAFPRLLGVLLGLMGDEDTASLRKLSVKAIANVVQADSALMVQPMVRKAVARRFLDEAISVREASVALVGSYVVQAPHSASVFHSSLLARLHDAGVSVRKRVVKIFRDVLVTNPSYEGRAEVCTVMLQRAADAKEDDGVRDLIHDTFQMLWFDSGLENTRIGAGEFLSPNSAAPLPQSVEGGSLAMSTIGTSNIANVSTASIRPARRKQSGESLAAEQAQIRCHAAAKQMVDVVAVSRNPDYLTKLVKELLFGLGDKGDKVNKAAARKHRQETAQKHCGRLVSSIMEQLLIFEEQKVNTGTQDTSFHLVALILTLNVFAEASPVLLLHHLDTLLPYLKADNGVSKELEAIIVGAISKIVSLVAPYLSAGDVARFSEGAVVDDLVKITYNFGSSTMTFAIEALSKLACHRDAMEDSPQRAKLMQLAMTFYTYLVNTRNTTDDFGQAKPGVRNNLYRALTALGSICRYDITSDSLVSLVDDLRKLDVTDPSELCWSNLQVSCLGVFFTFLSKSDSRTKCKALRAMGGIFTARPKIMLAVEQSGVISLVMAEDSHTDLQLEALRCWIDILLSEERRIESGEAKRLMESQENITLSKKICGDQDGDSSLVGGVLTQHTQRLYTMTTSMNPQIRLTSLDLIGHLLRQGLINPMDTVPYLLALQGDIGEPAVRSQALKLLMVEGQKRPDMLRQRVCAGIKRAYMFQRLVYPNSPRITALIQVENTDGFKQVECIFGRIFVELVRTSRVQRHGLIKTMLNLFGGEAFTTNTDNGDEDQASTKQRLLLLRNCTSSERRLPTQNHSFLEQLPLLCFAAETLAHLPYNNLGDVLLIIYQISCAIALDGPLLVDKFAAFLRPYGLACSDALDTDITQQDVLEMAAKKKFPGKTVSVTKSPKFKVKEFAELCAKASCLVLLMRLKTFLYTTFHVPDVRILEYLPNEKERISDRGISSSDNMPAFDSSVESFYKMNGGSEPKLLDTDSLIRQYAEFRKLMRANDRDGTSDETGSRGTHVKRKRVEMDKCEDNMDVCDSIGLLNGALN